MGEIVLVVIGILIALNLNIRSEKQNKITKVEAILADIMEELAADIIVSTDIIADYQIIDSLTKLVLDSKVKREDYANPRNARLIYLVEGANSYTTNHNSYDVLVNNIGDIPPRFGELIKSLNTLYKHILPELNSYNEQMARLVNDNHSDHAKNYDWYHQLPYHTSEGSIEYKLNDPKYKNKVRRIWWDGVRTHRKLICEFRISAIDNYKMIAELLHKATDTLPFILNEQVLERYVGKYSDGENKVIELFMKDDHLVMRDLQNHSEGNIYPLTRTDFFVFERGVVRFELDANEKSNALTYINGYLPSSYTRQNTD